MHNASRLLAVVAHPDDESIFLGGALRKCAENGIATTLVVLTKGETGRKATISQSGRVSAHTPRSLKQKKELADARRAECYSAATILGIQNLELLSFPTRGLSNSIIPTLKNLIALYNPHVVISLNEAGLTGGEGSRDHSWSGIGTYIACNALFHESRGRLALQGHFAVSLPFAPSRFDEWNEVVLQNTEYITVDISKQLEKKIAAVDAHQTQRHVTNYFTSVGLFQEQIEFFIPKIYRKPLPLPFRNIFAAPKTISSQKNLLLPEKKYSSSNPHFYQTLSQRVEDGLSYDKS